MHHYAGFEASTWVLFGDIRMLDSTLPSLNQIINYHPITVQQEETLARTLSQMQAHNGSSALVMQAERPIG
ncbi:MAG: hypothetical protein MUD01_25065, partial [Chloroflexaceae bacterium]|nr:hypothetical protein [Chloroflexaceae bacterium]